jgi:outer membrane receptor for ferrienterochelin and colicins
MNVISAQRTVRVYDFNLNQPLAGIEISCNSSIYLTNEIGQISVPLKEDLQFSIDSSIGIIVGPTRFKADTTSIFFEVKGYVSEINPVSITTSARPRLATDEAYSLRVVSSKTIKQMGAQTVADVIQNQTSIILNNDASLGTSMQLQGMGGQNVKILINGVPMVGRLNGNIDISQIPINEIEKIEIIEGPMSVVYGTDAIGGVINIITRNPYTANDRMSVNSYADGLKN